MKHPLDKRTIRYQPDPAALRRLEELRPSWLERELELAELLADLDRKVAFVGRGAESVEEFAARIGFDGFRAAELKLAGHALHERPELAELLRNRQVVFAAVIALGRLFRDPALYLAPKDDWVLWARTLRLRDLKRRVNQRVESVRQAKTVRPWSTHVSEETREVFEDCRTIASGKAKQVLTRGQTLTVLAYYYRMKNDVTLKPARERRARPTAETPFARNVPAEVVRAIYARSGGQCEVGGCPRPITERCHVNPRRDGSPREAEDLFGACFGHHRLYDLGVIERAGRTTDGRLLFRVVRTGELLLPKPTPEEREKIEQPEWLLRALGMWNARMASARKASAKGENAANGKAHANGKAGAGDGRRETPWKPPERPSGPPPDASEGRPSGETDGAGRVGERAPAPQRARKTPRRPRYHPRP